METVGRLSEDCRMLSDVFDSEDAYALSDGRTTVGLSDCRTVGRCRTLSDAVRRCRTPSDAVGLYPRPSDHPTYMHSALLGDRFPNPAPTQHLVHCLYTALDSHNTTCRLTATMSHCAVVQNLQTQISPFQSTLRAKDRVERCTKRIAYLFSTHSASFRG